ncbi:MAG TPA: GatB/YqeY domain-containing protein [Anaerolineae bacterium]|nr:GatB/YqeY domain-containing protein [Anaerolineae bacterium]
MSLKTQLQDDLKTALRANDPMRKLALRQTLAEIKNAEVAKIGELSDDEALAVLRTELKRRRETIAELETVSRPGLLAEAQAQLDVLSAYLPQQMSREQIAETAKAVLAGMGNPGPNQMGQVMKQMMAELKGKADGRLVQDVVRELIG